MVCVYLLTMFAVFTSVLSLASILFFKLWCPFFVGELLLNMRSALEWLIYAVSFYWRELISFSQQVFVTVIIKNALLYRVNLLQFFSL